MPSGNCMVMLWQVDASKGCVIVAQMSSDGCLANDEYTQSKSSLGISLHEGT